MILNIYKSNTKLYSSKRVVLIIRFVCRISKQLILVLTKSGVENKIKIKNKERHSICSVDVFWILIIEMMMKMMMIHSSSISDF